LQAQAAAAENAGLIFPFVCGTKNSQFVGGCRPGWHTTEKQQHCPWCSLVPCIAANISRRGSSIQSTLDLNKLSVHLPS